MEYKEVYESWLANPYFDEATKQELLSIKDDENEIKERFYADLEFGTAGLRGVIGAGLCCPQDNTGSGQLHYQAECGRQGRCHCI